MIPGNANPLLLASAAAAGPVEDNRSLRFNDGDTAYLGRTPSSAGNRRTWTFSVWFKRSELAASNSYNAIWSTGTDGDNYSTIYIDTNDQLVLQEYTGSTDFQFLAEPALRDVSAWYHYVVAFDSTQSTATDRMKIYINGSQVDSTGTRINPSQNYESMFNLTNGHSIGRNHAYNNFFFSGYMTHAIFIDGSQLSPTSFGAYDSNGVWQKADYSGTFGTNGFHLLDFANESTIGADSSGNNNDFTANNLSDTAGAGNDVLLDYPANGDTANDSGAGGQVNGNYCTLNPLDNGGQTLSNGNLDIEGASGAWKTTRATVGLSSGKWYWEFLHDFSRATSTRECMVGIAKANATLTNYTGSDANGWGYYDIAGNIYNNGSGGSAIASYDNGDIIGVAFDADNGKLYFSKNGTFINSGDPAAGTGAVVTGLTSGPYFPAFAFFGTGTNSPVNFGQRAFAYSAPSGFSPICTTLLPTPTIADGSDYFQTVLWSGTGVARSITTTGMSPDFVWYKPRNSSSYGHDLFDIVRGANNILNSNNTLAEYTETQRLTSFNSDGFSVGTSVTTNGSGTNYVGWVWDAGSSTVSNTDGDITTSLRASATAGFSIATYSGSGTNGDTIGHGLGVEPDFVIVKARSKSDNWRVYHSALGTGYMPQLDTGTVYTGANWQSISSTTLGLQNDSAINGSGHNYVAYFFAAVAFYSAFGSYEGTGSESTAAFQYTGFRPSFILLKNADSTSNWWLYDTAREPSNPAQKVMQPNQAFAEFSDTSSSTSGSSLDILSNGFRVRTGAGEINGSGQTVIWLAFAENPFQAHGGLAR